ncbi:MAG TPA: hypothetical protein VF026_15350 [Ktedonobacteraceae bacterium]
MSASQIEHTPSAYDYPLLIKHLLHTPLATAPEHEEEAVFNALQ